MFILVMAALIGGAAPVSLEPVSDAYLQYDNGTPNWVYWSGTYRGVWFNTEDFYPWPCFISVESIELWFYHHSSYPWDTSTTEIQLWTGNQSSPVSIIDAVEATAIHYAPIYVSMSPTPYVPSNFWTIQSTVPYSTGGWPSPLLDAGEATGPVHSFYFDTDMMPIPMTLGGKYTNYFFRISTSTSLERLTWGSLKTVF